ncbi:hypothetical protein GQ54DRAFT_141553 [Martensiomyces pterosporus]|nr:hypothetical protein GQ54DRAFT_141553 [Martensiomyces pterosporus]
MPALAGLCCWRIRNAHLAKNSEMRQRRCRAEKERETSTAAAQAKQQPLQSFSFPSASSFLCHLIHTPARALYSAPLLRRIAHGRKPTRARGRLQSESFEKIHTFLTRARLNPNLKHPLDGQLHLSNPTAPRSRQIKRGSALRNTSASCTPGLFSSLPASTKRAL